MRATRTEAEESLAVAGERGAVRTTDVTRIFQTRGREITALQHVSIEARGAEFVVLLGPSGCGKSTLFQIIAGALTSSFSASTPAVARRARHAVDPNGD